MKTFLSIGTGPGIGLATVERFAKEGFRVILSARDAGRTKAFVEQLKKKGYDAVARVVDASNVQDVARLITNVEQGYGSLDALHYNAASMRQATLAQQPIDTFVSDLAVNIGGALAGAQAALAHMATRGEGTILLTGGGYALNPSPDYLSLSIGKAGIHALAQGLFEQGKAQGVHVASVIVGALVSPGSKRAEEIAEQFWLLHRQPKDSWTAEVTYTG